MMKVVTDKNQINTFLNSRYIETVFPSKERAGEIMRSGERLVFYLGIDPTGPDIHLGHTTNLFILKSLAGLGHKIILLIGNFTAMIGDPTGKDTARKVLSETEVKENMKTYIDQVRKILPRSSFDVQYNVDWYRKMKAEEFIKLAGHFTVQQMIARDMFQRRISEGKPISLREFIYPLLQGYDSVAMKVDGEIGGNDQTFNMLVGRDLAKHILGKDKIVIATKLLEDPATGKKIMNKSEGQQVSLNDFSGEMLGKIMAMPDSTIIPLAAYATELSDSKVDEFKHALVAGENPKDIKEKVAYELVRVYHGDAEAKKAKDNFEKVFSKKELPEEIKEFEIREGKMSIVLVLKGWLGVSMTEAKRLIDQHAVSINEQIIANWDHEVKSGDVIKVGSRKFLRIK